MPIFTQQKKESKKRGPKAAPKIPQELINQAKEYIGQLNRSSIGTLEFKKGENVNLGRKALLQAAVELKKYLRVKRARGSDILTFERITAAEAKKKGKQKKVEGVEVKPKAKRKTKAKKKS